MDKKFNSDEQWFISPLINLQNFKEEAINSQNLMDSLVNNNDNNLKNILMERTGCSDEEASSTCIDNLSMVNFVNEPGTLNRPLELSDKNEAFLANSSLHIHKGVRQRDEYMESNRQRKSNYVSSLKYDKSQSNAVTSFYRKQCKFSDSCENDILILVDCMLPYNKIVGSSELRSSRLMRTQTKFLLRGETYLFELRKQLMCVCDMVVPLEEGREMETPNLDQSTAELYPSSFMFIHDTFYIDLSNPKAKDTSVQIREFMATKKIFEAVNAMDMCDVKIIDLNLRLGQPYIFQHSGTCEHLLVFHDLRLMHPTDPQPLDQYPLTMSDKTIDKKCEVCHRTNASFVVEKSELLATTFVYFCRECFREFNFTNGVKTNSFRAWPVYEMNRMKM